MKAISLTQPWASLVTVGAKQYETRGWKTDYRGPIAIHAAARFPTDARALCVGGPGFQQSPFRVALKAAGMSGRSLPSQRTRTRYTTGDLPLGKVLATAELAGIRSTDDPAIGAWINELERVFGDYSPGRYAWLLTNVQPLPEPIPAKGALSLWEWTPPREAS